MAISIKCFVLFAASKLMVGVQGAAGGEKCALEPPLPEEISNTEVTPEGKEALLSHLDCLKKECEDMGTLICKALGKGIPGHAADCPDAKEKFTCELDVVPFWEAIGDFDKPHTIADNCPETCEVCSEGSTSSPSAVAPKPSPKPRPKPAPPPAPTQAPKEDSTADAATSGKVSIPPLLFFAIFIATNQL